MTGTQYFLAVFLLAIVQLQGQPLSSIDPAQKKLVGIETCATCHEDIAKGFSKDRHHAIKSGCESCHGPGSIHAESLEAKDIVRKNISACASCHANRAGRAAQLMTGHARNQVDCFTCHGMHKPAPTSREVMANCTGCHTEVRAQFQKPHRHPVGQPGAVMTCMDCHNPHNARIGEPTCVRCHGNVRGPFVFEHAPVRLEGCKACHEPHGSANPKMLTRQDERFVCLECHANIGARNPGVSGAVPPAIHDLRSARFRNCSTCHVKVHGSHANRSFLR